jgi:hypothetical protein
VRLTSPSRRAAGLLAATTIGLSTAVLSVPGVAFAAPSSTLPSLSVSTAEGDTSVTVPAGICAITWKVIGGQGGDNADGPGAAAGELRLTTEVAADDEFTLAAGTAGTPTAGGTNSQDSNGTAGIPGIAGGGAASEVLKDGKPFLLAYGGDGSDAAEPFGQGYGDEANVVSDNVNYMNGNDFDSATNDDGGSKNEGDGVVTGEGVLCSAPEAPYADSASAGDGIVTVRFFAPQSTYDDGESVRDDDGNPRQAVAGYEASVDGGDTWTALSTNPGTGGDEALYGSVSGLTNGTSYDVVVRATSVVGPSGASDPVSATPLAVIGEPTDVTTAVGASSIVISWQPPADDTGVTGYEAWAIPGADPQSSQGMVFCPAMGAAARSCVLAVESGQQYSVGVAALGDGGARGSGSFIVTDVVPAATAPSSVPAADATLTTDKGAVSSLTAGQQVVLEGEGYLPGSTVELYIYSTPTHLGSVLVGADGAFTATVTVPTGFYGSHSLVAAGVDEDGNPRYSRMDITVAEDPSSLAYTGFSALPFVGGGLLALVAGAGLLVASRRRA